MTNDPLYLSFFFLISSVFFSTLVMVNLRLGFVISLSLSLSNHLELLSLPNCFSSMFTNNRQFFSLIVLAKRKSIPQFCTNMYRSLCILVPISSFPSLYFPSLSIIFLPFTFIISLDNFHVYFPNLFSLFFLPVFSSFFLFFILLDSFHFSLQQFSSPFLYFIPLLPSSFFFNFSINIPSLFDGIHIYICILNIFLFFFPSTKKKMGGGGD